MQSRPYRSTLFVPATRPQWLERAVDSPADAIIVDLEDAVPEPAKQTARRNAEAYLHTLIDAGRDVYVRINPVTTPHWLADLEAVVQPGLVGIAVPKIYRTREMFAVAEVLSALESERGIEPGATDMQPLLETALGMHSAFEILSSSARVHSCFAGSARDGDANRELGFQWSKAGDETFTLRATLLMQARAAGVRYPISGTWVDIADHDGLAAFAQQSAALGYTGMYVIHPGHIEIVNRAFTPSVEQLQRYRAIVAEFERAMHAGHGAATFEGGMIDAAMVSQAEEFLRFAQQLGVDDDEDSAGAGDAVSSRAGGEDDGG
ncbi:MAG TPA: CoA ester lyase [Solirubrobacteraceae bacterium]|jgi:citrate lyase subunit beta/citryl-CoA lyase